uniref:Protein kinase domain-containing protein n=1 Tax=Parascaris univalens TaxID=6257 RepID=A0A915A3D8_PARUN
VYLIHSQGLQTLLGISAIFFFANFSFSVLAEIKYCKKITRESISCAQCDGLLERKACVKGAVRNDRIGSTSMEQHIADMCSNFRLVGGCKFSLG